MSLPAEESPCYCEGVKCANNCDACGDDGICRKDCGACVSKGPVSHTCPDGTVITGSCSVNACSGVNSGCVDKLADRCPPECLEHDDCGDCQRCNEGNCVTAPACSGSDPKVCVKIIYNKVGTCANNQYRLRNQCITLEELANGTQIFTQADHSAPLIAGAISSGGGETSSKTPDGNCSGTGGGCGLIGVDGNGQSFSIKGATFNNCPRCTNYDLLGRGYDGVCPCGAGCSMAYYYVGEGGITLK